MASSVKISQLAAVNAATNDDVFIINDSGINTRKITYANLTRNLISNSGDQSITGDVVIDGKLTVNELEITLPLITISAEADAVGVGTDDPQQKLDVAGDIRVRDAYQLQLGDYDNTNYVGFRAPNVLATDFTYIMPGAYPTSDGQVLSSTTSGEWSWITSLTDPTTSVGDMVFRDILNRVARLPIGNDGQVLTVRGDGIPGWLDAPQGFADPLQSRGDIIYRNNDNVTSRLAAGGVGQALIVGGNGLPSWQTVSAAAGGNNTEVQYNSNGSLAASSAFTWDSGSNILNVENLTVADEVLVEGPSTFEGSSTFENSVTFQAFLDANSNVSLGTNTANTLSINALINTPLLSDGALNIGADNRRWGDIYMGSTLSLSDGAVQGNIEFDSLIGYMFDGQGVNQEPARIRIYAEESNNGVTIQSPLEAAYTAGSYTLTLPTEQAASGITSFLANDGTGQLSFVPDTSGTSDLQDVTDNGSVTTNTIEVGGLIVNGQEFPAPGLPTQVLITDDNGDLAWSYVDADLY